MGVGGGVIVRLVGLSWGLGGIYGAGGVYRGPRLTDPPRPPQELELQAQLHGLPLSPPAAPAAEVGCEEAPGGPPFPPGGPPTPQCLLDLALADDLPPGLGLPLGLGGAEGSLDDILMDEGGGLSPLGPPGALLASPGPSRASSPRSSLSMEDDS